jgi:hypothetical protein
MFKRNLCAALVFGAAAAAPPMGLAQASVPCFERDQLIETLKSRYQESQTGGGLQQSGNLLEIWSSADTGSFTVFITDTSGQSCVVSSGENWHWIIRSGVSTTG